MDEREKLRSLIFEIVDKHLTEGQPAEAKATFERLLKQGYSEFMARQLLGQCVIVELHDVMISQKPFNEERYTVNLRHLPNEPRESI